MGDSTSSSFVINTFTNCTVIEGGMSESTFEGNVDIIQCEHTSKVDNICSSNVSTNCMPDDMLPRDTNNCVDNIISLDTLNSVPDLPYSLFSSVKSASSSSCEDENDDKQNFTCKRLCEIRVRNINKVIVAELNINSIRYNFEQLVENINKNVDILLIVETKLDDSFPINQFYIEGYQQFRVDRSSHGGGLICYVI